MRIYTPEDVARLQAERDELLKAVTLLAKSADDIPVYPGQHLFRLGPDGKVKAAIVQIRVTSLDGYSEVYALNRCYATREAAIARCEGGKDGKQ